MGDGRGLGSGLGICYIPRTGICTRALLARYRRMVYKGREGRQGWN